MTMHFPGPSLHDLIVKPSASVLDAMRTLDRGYEIALVCEGDRLVGLVTDGDIRRSLLNGGSLQRQVAEIATRDYFSVGPETSRAQAIQIMTERRYKCLPVIDGERRLLDLYTLHGALLQQRVESWAVVMAGGRGERLGELTQATPKPMLPVDGRPILEHLVYHLVSHGIRRVFLSVNYLGKMIEDHFQDGSRFSCAIEYLREDEPLGTGGSLSLLPERPSHPLVVMNGDLMTRVNVSRMLGLHSHGHHAATIAIREYMFHVPFGVAQVEGGLLTALHEKPSHRYFISAGIYVLEPELVARVPRAPFQMTDLIKDALTRREAIACYPMQESWSDMGVPGAFGLDGR